MEEPKYTKEQIRGWFTNLAEFGVDYPEEYKGMFNLISRMTAKSLVFKLKNTAEMQTEVMQTNKQRALGELQKEVSKYDSDVTPAEFHLLIKAARYQPGLVMSVLASPKSKRNAGRSGEYHGVLMRF